MSSSSLISSVPTLTGPNWLQWSNMMKAYLQSQGLWLLVSAEEPKPEMPSASVSTQPAKPASTTASSSESSSVSETLRQAQKELIEWKNRDSKAIGSITLKIADNLRTHVADTSAETWNALKLAFGDPTHGTVYHWVTKLLNFRLSGDVHPHKEFAELLRIQEQVKACQVAIDEYIIVLMIFKNIPKRYEHLASTMLSGASDPSKVNIASIITPIVTE